MFLGSRTTPVSRQARQSQSPPSLPDVAVSQARGGVGEAPLEHEQCRAQTALLISHPDVAHFARQTAGEGTLWYHRLIPGWYDLAFDGELEHRQPVYNKICGGTATAMYGLPHE